MSDASKIVHQQLRRARGSASEFVCSGCMLKPAYEWAYQHTDSEAVRTPEGQLYSTNFEHYKPMCRSCHRKLDWEKTPEKMTGQRAALLRGVGDSSEMARRGRLAHDRKG